MKIVAIFLYGLLPFWAWAQSGETVSLRWKLAPGEILVYNTVMADQAPKEGSGAVGNTDSLSKPQQLLQQLLKERADAQRSGYLSYLRPQHNGGLSVEMTMRPATNAAAKTANAAQPAGPLAAAVKPAVVLRGVLNSEGAVESFYLKTEQKNLVALLFQLPAALVKVGDSWPLEVNFILVDQSFQCDSAYRRNRVTCSKITHQGAETIATLLYDMEEMATGSMGIGNVINQKTTMRIVFTGSAEFSVTRGRWKSYHGVMAIASNGMMNVNPSRVIALEPMDSP